MENEALTIIYPIIFGFLSILVVFINTLMDREIGTYRSVTISSVMMSSSLALLGTTLFYSISSPVDNSPLMIFLTVISGGIFIIEFIIMMGKIFDKISRY